MTSFTCRGSVVDSVFDLLGTNEDDMTYALGWTLSHSPTLQAEIARAMDMPDLVEMRSIKAQVAEKDKGRTDLELKGLTQGAAIVEAKCGWNLPTVEQLGLYVDRKLMTDGDGAKAIIVLTQHSSAYVDRLQDYPKSIKGIPIKSLSWSEVLIITKNALQNASALHEKWNLSHFELYLMKEVGVNRLTSNWTYVVSMTYDPILGGISPIDLAVKHGKYMHPIGNRYPVEPVNYIAFRYDGVVKSIHHVDHVEEISSFDEALPSHGLDKSQLEPHFLYTLGPAIEPPHEVRSGNIRNTRYWCHLDTLLIAKNVKEASEMTKQRMAEIEEA